ncbi:IS110 family transposase, partial [Amaricoccus sp. HAR-UPW-R2A-40]
MPSYAALDVSQETTAICVVDEAGRILAEKKVATCPDAITSYLTQKAPDLVRVG